MRNLITIFLVFAGINFYAQSWPGFSNPQEYDYTLHTFDGNTVPPSTVFFADFNNDGHIDFLLDGNVLGQSRSGDYLPNAYFFINKGDGTFKNENLFNKGNRHRIITDVADFNKDGNQDLLVADFWGNGFRLYTGDGNLKFNQSIYKRTNTHGGTTKFADLDNDGDLDIVSVSAGSGVPVNIRLYENKNGTLAAPRVFRYSYQDAVFYNNLQIEDIDGDNRLDIFLSIWEGDADHIILYQTGNWQFMNLVENYYRTQITGRSSMCQLVDYNEDGYMDYLFNQPGMQTADPRWFTEFKVWIGKKEGFSLFPFHKDADHRVIHPEFRSARLWFPDLNADGKNDLVTYEHLYELGDTPKPIMAYIKKDTHDYMLSQTLENKVSQIKNYNFNGGLGFHDLNKDGSPDMVAIREKNVYVYLNKHQMVAPPEPEKNEAFVIYPTPTTGQITVKSGNNDGNIKKIKIYNVKGQLVRRIEGVDSNTKRISVAALSAGTYFLIAELDSGKEEHAKFVKF